jgi:L,D-peptidoglycan transpeptidase YkuD (ErfK/YbiS/YcfS/YnhG family)
VIPGVFFKSSFLYMRQGYRGLVFTIVLIILIPLVIWMLIRLTPLPPEEDMHIARETLSEARHDKADTYSRRLYAEAKVAYDSAMNNWKRENRKFIFFRNYEKVGTYARISAKKASQATESSNTNSSTLKVRLQDKIESVNKTASNIEKLFSRYPMPSEIRTRISKGNLLLKEGEDEYSKGQYLPANTKINEAEYLLTGVYENTTAELRDYFRSFSTWKQWIQSAIIESRTNRNYSIIVDKFSRKCYVYLSGEKKYEFDTELGRNWVGNKRRMGDKATPEGVYKIVNKFQGGQTEYYKSLSLDYPNARDKERFRSEISKGTLPGWAKIGGGIEIHGGGGKGVDWTEGCIALTDSEIDLVYSIAKVGTPVTIVGSIKDISQILDN